MEVDKSLLVRLRKETLAPFAACAEALITSNNNYEEAKKILFKKSILKTASSYSSDDLLPEGKIYACTNSDYSLGILLALRAQTDFVTNSEDFKKAQIEIGRALLEEFTKSKPESSPALEQILSLKSKEDNLTIEEKISSLSSITREKIELKEVFVSPAAPNHVTLSYQHHNSKLGALLTLKSNKKIDLDNLSELKKLVTHFAASESLFLTEDQITKEWRVSESEKIKSSLISKNPNIPNIERIIEKQLQKIASEAVFSMQSFILDPSLKISSILSKYELTPVWGKKITL